MFVEQYAKVPHRQVLTNPILEKSNRGGIQVAAILTGDEYDEFSFACVTLERGNETRRRRIPESVP